jgi:hypothetical protein
MKKIIFLLLFAVQGLWVIAQDDKDLYSTTSLKETVKDVEVQTSGGSINVNAVTSNARIEVYIRGNNGKELSKDEIKQRLDEMYTLDINVSNGKLTAIARSKSNIKDWKRALSISFKVFVPKNVATDLSTSGGSISLTGLAGKQDFKTSGGSLHVKDVSGTITGRTSGGSIHVENATQNIDLTTSGGSIHAKNCKGDIKLNTSGGSLDLSGLDGTIKASTSGGGIRGENIGGELNAHTSGGSIRLANLTCSVDASTSGGNIDVSVASLGKYIKLRNSGGNIDLEVPAGKGLNLDLAGNRVKTDRLTNFNGKAEDDQLEGTVNGGGIPVTVKSGSGRVSLAFK